MPSAPVRPRALAFSCALLALVLAAAPAAGQGAPALPDAVEEGLVLAYDVRDPEDVDDSRSRGTLRFHVRALANGTVEVAFEARPADDAGHFGIGDATFVLDAEGLVLRQDAAGDVGPLDVGVDLGLWLDLEHDPAAATLDFHGRPAYVHGFAAAMGMFGLVLLPADEEETPLAVYHGGDGLLEGFAWGDGLWAYLDAAASTFPSPRADPTGDRIVLGGMAAVFLGIVLGTNVVLERRHRGALALAWPAAYCAACGAPAGAAEPACAHCRAPMLPGGGSG